MTVRLTLRVTAAPSPLATLTFEPMKGCLMARRVSVNKKHHAFKMNPCKTGLQRHCCQPLGKERNKVLNIFADGNRLIMDNHEYTFGMVIME